MSAHTPGPWTVEIDRWHYDTASTVGGGSDRERFPFRELLVQVGGTDVERQEANARLIAAEQARVALSDLIATGDRRVFAAALSALDAAIDKARGVTANAAVSGPATTEER